MRHPFSLLFLLLLFACMQLLVLPGWASDVPPAGDTTPLQSPIMPEPAPAAVADPVAPKRKDDELTDPIMPTMGRIVLHRGRDGLFRPAIVTHVWGVFCVNLFVFGKDSSDVEAGPRTSVTHADPAQEPDCLDSWNWMPYQLGQQKKTEAVIAATNPDELAALRDDLATALATIAVQAEAIAALRAEYDATKGHVQRIGECPGLKLF